MKKYNIKQKHELLDVAIGLAEKYIEKKDGKYIITKEGFIEFKNRRIGTRKRKIFVDEAQDCHKLEKEILLNIYGSQKTVVASGGKEQLIRHIELCNWEVLKGKRLQIKKHRTLNKSYRIKKTAVDFCNYIASKFVIDLNLEPLDTEDVGEIIFDFRKTHSDSQMIDLLKYLNTKGEINSCTPYESLMILLDASKIPVKITIGSRENESAVINEYDNIEEGFNLQREEWSFKRIAANNDILFWDGTVEDKSKRRIPSSLESRLIYYESCRGLEAWSVMCFHLDSFFNRKRNDQEAEKYLIGDIFLSMDNERRESMYSATWVLMALTRAIDTLYLQIDDKDSEFGELVIDYITLNKDNKNIKVYQ